MLEMTLIEGEAPSYDPETQVLTQSDVAGVTSPKLNAVRAWMDGMIAAGVADSQELRSDWPAAPFTFAEASGEALQQLADALSPV